MILKETKLDEGVIDLYLGSKIVPGVPKLYKAFRKLGTGPNKTRVNPKDVTDLMIDVINNSEEYDVDSYINKSDLSAGTLSLFFTSKDRRGHGYFTVGGLESDVTAMYNTIKAKIPSERAT